MIWEMSPAKRHPLYPQALVNRRMLNTHEYCLVFNRKTQPELREFYDMKLKEDEDLSKKVIEQVCMKTGAFIRE